MKKLLKYGLIILIVVAILPELLSAGNEEVNWNNVLQNGKKIVSSGVRQIKYWINNHPEEVDRIKKEISEISSEVTKLASGYLMEHGTDTEEDINLSGPYAVTRVVDGDTLVVSIDGTDTKVRLIGVDTPESVHANASKNVPEGTTASDYTKELLTNTKVYLESDAGPTDKYGRTLAYVYTEDGVMVNNLLLEEGMAKLMTIQPNVKYVDLFTKTQETARENKAGFWADYFDTVE